MAAAIIIGVVILALAIGIGLKQHNKLVSEGKIISRSTRFMENAEIFTLTLSDSSKVTEGIKGLPYGDMGSVEMKGSSENQAFQFTGRTWAAQLRRGDADGEKSVYRFEFTNWKTHNGMPEDGTNMNKLLTAIEKMFVAIDPGTQVRTEPIEFKTKHNFF